MKSTAPKAAKQNNLRLAAKEEGMDVTQLLHADHQKVAELFFQYSELEEDDTQGKDDLATMIIDELTIHATVEEQVVYPAIRKADDESKEMMDEADTEHHVVKFLLSELAQMSAEEDYFDSKICVLRELVNHHVQEEEKEMFDALKEAKVDLEALGKKVIMFKEKLAKTPPAKTKTLATSSKTGLAKKSK
jgi:hemerythrin superfamily protein